MWVKKEIGNDMVEETKPTAPVKKPKSIVKGIRGNTKILAGNATSEIRPMSYKISGKTII